MIMDKNLTFLENTSVAAASTGTALVGDVIDLDATGRRLFSNTNLKLAIVVTTAFASGTSSTIQFQLASDATANIAVDGTQTIHIATEVFTDAELTAGTTIYVDLPGGMPVFERYLGLQVVTGSAATTAGSITAALVMDVQDWRAEADASN